MSKTHYRACHLCEAICGLVIEVDGDRITSIKGDKNDPLSRGHICPKAVALKDLHRPGTRSGPRPPGGFGENHFLTSAERR